MPAEEILGVSAHWKLGCEVLFFTRTPSLARACARACAPTPSAHVPARATSASDSAVHCDCRSRSCRPMSIMPSLSKGSDLVTPHALSSSLTPDRRQNASRIPCSQSDVSFDHGRLAQTQRMEDTAASSGGSHKGTDPEDGVFRRHFDDILKSCF